MGEKKRKSLSSVFRKEREIDNCESVEKEGSVIISFRLFYDNDIDRFILKNFEEVKKGKRTGVIKEALYFYFSRYKSGK